jgi:transglutaminase-like putative cysteine protease
MPRTTRLAVAFLLVLFARLVSAAPPAMPKETAKYGVYLNNARIGSMVTRLLDTTVDGKPALRMEADMEVKITALGSAIEQKVRTWHVLDPQGAPITSWMSMHSLGRETTITSRYEPTRVVSEIVAGGQKSEKIVPIPEGVKLSGDPQLSGAPDGELKVGAKMTVHFFEPMTMTIQKVSTEVLKQEKRTVAGKSVDAFLLKSTNSITGTSETWVDRSGHLLEDTSRLGLRLVREDVQSLTALTYEPPKDFAVATSVKTTVKLPNARTLRSLRLKVSGLPDDGVILSDVRQRVSGKQQEGDTLSAVYHVQFRELPQVSLPLAPPDAKGPGLGDAAYLNLDDPEIRKQAELLAKDAPDRAAVARRVRSWVKGHMEKQNNIAALRSAPEILKTRDGVCRDYATLFAAVARAAGLPTRICSGIVYFQDGFFYHAWNEVQLTDGPDGWYPFDSTLDSDFVDATHVKFAQGDPVEMFAAIRVIGQIKAEILEYK